MDGWTEEARRVWGFRVTDSRAFCIGGPEWSRTGGGSREESRAPFASKPMCFFSFAMIWFTNGSLHSVGGGGTHNSVSTEQQQIRRVYGFYREFKRDVPLFNAIFTI